MKVAMPDLRRTAPAQIAALLCAFAVHLLSGVFCGARASPADAQPEPPPAPGPEEGARRLELAEALELARKNNRDLEVARLRLREVQADVDRALSALLPRLNVQGKYTFNYPEVNITFASSATTTSSVLLQPQNQVDGTVAASVPLVVPSAYPALQGARRSYQGQQRQLAATEAQLLQTVASAFVAAAAAEGMARIRGHAIEVTQETLSTSRLRFRQGMVTRLDVSRAELAALQAQQRLRAARDARSAAYRALADLLLLRAPFQVVPPPEPALIGAGEDALVAEAMQRRQEIPALQATIEAAEAQERAARLRWAPTLSASGALRVTNASGFADQYVYFTGGLQLDWQAFDGRERDIQGRIAAAQAAAARLKLAQLRDSIASSVRNGREQLLSRREGLEEARQALRLAQEALGLVRLQQGAGTATQLDLLTAQDQLVAAEVGVEQARLDLCLQGFQLRSLIGGPLLGR